MEISLVGNLTDDPIVAINDKNARLSFTLAVSESYRDSKTGEWKSQEPTFWTCFAWRNRAKNIANEQLVKGNRVVLRGTIRANVWQDETGGQHRRTVVDIQSLGKDVCAGQPAAAVQRQEALALGTDKTTAWDAPAPQAAVPQAAAVPEEVNPSV